jgi:hypothetical protein
LKSFSTLATETKGISAMAVFCKGCTESGYQGLPFAETRTALVGPGARCLARRRIGGGRERPAGERSPGGCTGY